VHLVGCKCNRLKDFELRFKGTYLSKLCYLTLNDRIVVNFEHGKYAKKLCSVSLKLHANLHLEEKITKYE
jgi:hypothetical protein